MKRCYRRVFGIGAATITLAACVQTPVVPMIPAAPGPNKTFDAFGADQSVCQQYAGAQTAPAAAAANSQAVGGAILSTALGAGLGAAIGGGRGAAIGAASGAAFGTAVGAGGSSYAQMSVQQQYDILYGQCMVAHGNQVPGFSPPPDAPRYPGGPMPPPPGARPYPAPPGYPGGPGYGGAPPYSGAPVPPPPGY
jgi:outer membrane lipoprotein SlyB